MRNKLRCLIIGLLVGGMLMCPASAGSVFPDVDDSAPYADAVEFVKEAGIMNGSSSGNFNPNSTVTRAEMATILCNMIRETNNLTTSDTFSDVPASHWANKYVSKANELGIVNGYGNGKFGPSDAVIYEQAVTMVINAIGGNNEAQKFGGYPDGYLSVANQYGFIENVDMQKGLPLSRAHVAIIIYNCRGFSFNEGDAYFNDGAQID